MTSPIYNTETAKLIGQLADSLPQALLLEGMSGVGLATIARHLAWRDLAGFIQPTDREGSVDTSGKGVIRIPQIRELIEQSRGKFTTRQVFIIDDADKMNHQAQNAFLKLLEEPAPNIHFILTAHTPHQLLATILSRVQRIRIRPVSNEDSKRLISKLGVTDSRKVQQLLFLANGRPAEIARLAANEKLFAERATLMTDARELIQGKPYSRALVVSRYYNDRAKTLQLLELAQTIITFTLVSAPSKELVDMVDRLATTYERIAANGNVRLQLMNFVVH